jgi:hypothetical protein
MRFLVNHRHVIQSLADALPARHAIGKQQIGQETSWRQ